VATTAVMAGAWIAYHRIERSRMRHIDVCAGCAERDCGVVCSGYRYQASCLRKYEDDATSWLERQYARHGSTRG